MRVRDIAPFRKWVPWRTASASDEWCCALLMSSDHVPPGQIEKCVSGFCTKNFEATVIGLVFWLIGVPALSGAIEFQKLAIHRRKLHLASLRLHLQRHFSRLHCLRKTPCLGVPRGERADDK